MSVIADNSPTRTFRDLVATLADNPGDPRADLYAAELVSRVVAAEHNYRLHVRIGVCPGLCVEVVRDGNLRRYRRAASALEGYGLELRFKRMGSRPDRALVWACSPAAPPVVPFAGSVVRVPLERGMAA